MYSITNATVLSAGYALVDDQNQQLGMSTSSNNASEPLEHREHSLPALISRISDPFRRLIPTTTAASPSPKLRNPSNVAYSTRPRKSHTQLFRSHRTRNCCSLSAHRCPCLRPCHCLPAAMLNRSLHNALRSHVAAVVRGKWALVLVVQADSRTCGESISGWVVGPRW